MTLLDQKKRKIMLSLLAFILGIGLVSAQRAPSISSSDKNPCDGPKRSVQWATPFDAVWDPINCTLTLTTTGISPSYKGCPCELSQLYATFTGNASAISDAVGDYSPSYSVSGNQIALVLADGNYGAAQSIVLQFDCESLPDEGEEAPLVIDQVYTGGLCVIGDIAGVDCDDFDIFLNVANQMLLSPVGGNGNGGGVQPGTGISLAYAFPVLKKLYIETSLTRTKNPFTYEAPELIPNGIDLLYDNDDQLQSFVTHAATAGPSLRLGKGKWQSNLYTRAGIAFTQSPEQFVGLDLGIPSVNEYNGLSKFSGTSRGFILDAGARLNYQLSKHWALFGQIEYSRSLNPFYTYSEKDVAAAYVQGHFLPNAFESLPFEKRAFGLQSWSAGLGIRFTYRRCRD